MISKCHASLLASLAMNSFDAARRDLLKFGSLGLAASAAAAAPVFAAALPHGASAKPASPLIFDVRSFGAKGDGKAVDTAAINAAIEAAAAAGGGTVYFPSGAYLSFSIHLKSKVDLYLSQGCALIAADSPRPGETTGYMGGTYDAAEPKTSYDAYQDFGHNHWHNSLLWGENLTDISITGPGLIWGRGLSFGAGPGRPAASSGANGRGFGPERVGTPPPAAERARPPRGDYSLFQAEQDGVGNKAIALKNCRNVIFRDFSILKAGHFGLLLTGVDNVSIDNLKIDTDRDGMDIDCCKNVRVSNCTVNSPWDDGICPKSSFALGYNRPTENVTITNCYVTGAYRLGSVLDGTFEKFDGSEKDHGKIGGTGRIKCGTESNGGFINITISNCVFEGCQGLALETVDGALLEDIAVTNITMRDVISCPIFLRLGSRLRGPKGTGNQSTDVGTLRRVLISNVTSYNTAGKYGSNITGIPGFPIEDLKISDIYVEHVGGGTAEQARIQVPEKEDGYPEPGMLGVLPAHGFYFRHVNRLEMSHVEVRPKAPDARPAIYTDDVHRADFLFITAPNAAPAFSLNKSTDTRILMSRAAPDSIVP
jgi:polygalacturonase